MSNFNAEWYMSLCRISVKLTYHVKYAPRQLLADRIDL